MNKLRLCAAAIAALVIVALTPTGGGATFPGNNGRILFTRGSFERPVFLVSMDPDGSDPTRLTRRSRNAFGASWAPDGSRFVYSQVDGEGNVDLFLRNADGSNRIRVTNSKRRDEFQAAFGPDGNQVVYQGCAFQCDLFTKDLTTGTRTRVTHTRADEIAPDWSVDDVIVYERSPRRRGDIEIFTIHPDGTTRRRLTDNRRLQDVSASWSPDGSRIVYSRCGFEAGCDLFTMNPNGFGRTRITRTRADEFGAHFSPDGRFLVMTRSRGEGRGDLFRLRANGRHPHRLTDTPNKFEVDADWQPNP